jgi:hypothetical protein
LFSLRAASYLMAESDAMTTRVSVPFPDAMTARVSVPFTTNHPVATMAAGHLATGLRRFATAAIVKPVEVAGHPRLLTDPRLLPARCPLFRRVAVVARVVVAVEGVVEAVEGDGKSFAKGTPDYW